MNRKIVFTADYPLLSSGNELPLRRTNTDAMQERDHMRRDCLRALLVGGHNQVGALACRGKPLKLLRMQPVREVGLASAGDRTGLGVQQDQGRGLTAMAPELTDHRMLLRDCAGRVSERRETCDEG